MPRDFTTVTKWYSDKGLKNIDKDGIGSISQFFQVLEHWCKQELKPWLFRGERKAYPAPLAPTITRVSDNPIYEESRWISDQELAEVRKAQKATGAIKEDPLVTTGLDNDDPLWIPLAQHYGFKTRLLDVSLDPLGALFFACQPAPPDEDEEDGFVFFMFSGSLRQHVGLGGSNAQDYSILPHNQHSNAKEVTTLLNVFELETALHCIDFELLLAPRLRNWREIAQRGLFIWWSDPWRDSRFQACPIRVKADKKADIRSALAVLGVTDQVLALHRP